MRSVTLSVGPLAAASANSICTTQTATVAGQYALNGTPTNGTLKSSFVATGSIAGNVLTISAMTSGVVTAGAPLNGLGVAAGTIVTRAGTISKSGNSITGTGGTGTYLVSIPQTVASTTLRGTRVSALDTARRVLITTTADESLNTFTITGTDWNGSPITELITGIPASTAGQSNMDFATVTSVSINGAASGAITVGTNGVASSRWMLLDEWAPPQTTILGIANGTVNYTIQQAQEVPNDTIAPYQVNWANSLDPNAIGATTNILTFLTYVSRMARVLLNSGTGTASAVITQTGVVPY